MPTNSHLLGTARMGEDPASSVVDPWGVAHDVRNLAIIDGSVFVTVGSANPTSTISALALRATEHLLAHRADVPVPEPSRSFAVSGPGDLAPVPVREPTNVALPVTARERDRLRALADALVPGDERMPAASDVGVAADLLDAVLRARPDLDGELRRALAVEIDDPQAAIDDLRRGDPPAYRALVLLVLAAYYRSPDVRSRIGWPGPEGAPVGRFDYPEYLTEGLLDHLTEERHA
jgi:hypothetical protein